MFSRFLKVAIATSNFMNEVYNGGFLPEFNISMLKKISFRLCIGNLEIKSETSGKI